MKLKIKGEEDKEVKEISLERSGDCVKVRIDGEIVVTFWDDGESYFYGQGNLIRYEGKWDK